VPIGFHPDRVVGFNAGNRGRWNRKLDGQLASPAANEVRATNFVMRSGFHEIHESGHDFRFAPLLRRCLRLTVPLFDAKRKDVFESRGFAAMRRYRIGQLAFSAEPPERFLTWEGIVRPRLATNLAMNREPPQSFCEPDVIFNQDLVADSCCKFIRGVSGLNQGIAPPEPNMWIPVRFLDSSRTLKRSVPWRLATVVKRNPFYLREIRCLFIRTVAPVQGCYTSVVQIVLYKYARSS